MSDLEPLVSRILDFATRTLAEDGFLIPIGAGVALDGEMVPVSPLFPPDENGMDEAADALVIFYESASGDAQAIITLYSGAPGPETKFEPPFSQATDAAIFTGG